MHLPLEAKYADAAFAERVYRSLVETLLANGTTTAVYFGTIHLESTLRLAELCLARGQRAWVGKVAMDNPDQCPDFYRDPSVARGLDDTRALIEGVRGMPGNEAGLVKPVVTPRFIPACTDAMLRGLGELAQACDCHVQTHCSESDWEHAYVIERHGMRDALSLERFGLLTDKTVLAHANFIDKGDMEVIQQAQTGIAHCPLSNHYFSNAVFPARKVLDQGLQVGLGTDISGGANPSLLCNCAMAVTSSRALEEGVDPDAASAARGAPGGPDRLQGGLLDGDHRRRPGVERPHWLVQRGLRLRCHGGRCHGERQQSHPVGGSGPGRRPVAKNYLQRRPAQHRQGVDPGSAGEGRRLRRGRGRPARRPPTSGGPGKGVDDSVKNRV